MTAPDRPAGKGETRITPFAIYFDGMSWPNPSEHCDEMNWGLRYGNAERVEKHRLGAASVVAAYQALVLRPKRERDRIIRELRKAWSHR